MNWRSRYALRAATDGFIAGVWLAVFVLGLGKLDPIWLGLFFVGACSWAVLAWQNILEAGK